MKISKTQDGQIFIDPFDKFRSPKGRIVGISIGVVVLGVIPAIFFCYLMQSSGTPYSALIPSFKAEPVASAPPPAPAPEPTPDPNAVLSRVGQPLGDYHVMAFDQYTVAMATTDGMTEWLLQIEQGYSDGNISLIMTPYFEMQSEPVRAEVAQILLDAWKTIYTQEATLGVTISLFDRQGNSLGAAA